MVTEFEKSKLFKWILTHVNDFWALKSLKWVSTVSVFKILFIMLFKRVPSCLTCRQVCG
jgi:hypothetical protein